ncbi:MAG: nickel pincer cofactor biosynthesis protein LarB [Methanosphaera sp.]|nr:nickel pincer cofactor biosynthesis protein LarB [Methanosphaera sp.]
MREILSKLINNEISISEAEEQLKINQIQELGDNVKFDDNRKDRVGIPEAVYSHGKTDDDLLTIINNLKFNDQLMVTKLGSSRFNQLKNQINSDVLEYCTYHDKASILTINKSSPSKLNGKVGIITAGTADIPVAEEARITIEQSGFDAIKTYDVGVAGIHRLIDKITYLLEEHVDVIITIAGMEGALPSVVAGLVDTPVIAVPTSTGYGVGEKGFTALFAMLQSCAPGIAVMNIDNGYGAGVYAITILNQINKRINNDK